MLISDLICFDVDTLDKWPAEGTYLGHSSDNLSSRFDGVGTFGPRPIRSFEGKETVFISIAVLHNENSIVKGHEVVRFEDNFYSSASSLIEGDLSQLVFTIEEKLV